jgi:hypothetical protein
LKLAPQLTEVAIEIRLAAKLFRRIDAALCELLVDNEAVARIVDCRREHLFPLKLAETPLRLPQTLDRTRHADRAVAVQAHAGHDLARLVEIHVAGGGERRALAIVEEIRLTARIDRHEPAAADVARLGIRDGQRERDCDRGVDRIAALFEDLFRGVRAVLVGDGDRRTGQHHGLRFLCIRRRAGQEADSRRPPVRRRPI